MSPRARGGPGGPGRGYKGSPEAGWELIHVRVDDCSRLADVEVVADEKGLTAAGSLERAVAWFAARGVRVRRVMSDDHKAPASRLSAD